jgi:hypothetical protein
VGVVSTEQVMAEEADAIHGITQGSIIEALRAQAVAQPDESRRTRKDADARSGKDEDPTDVKKRQTFYCTLNHLNRAALCCSGGGIRSATFCLGVIQALAMHSLNKSPPGTASEAGQAPDQVKEANDSALSRFHYLSTVSGGGYIGSWLSAWRHRNDFPTVWRNLSSRPDGPDMEPPEISWLRAYSNYLTPTIGLFSADSWTGVAIYVRNLVLNWLVIVPAVALVLLALKFLATGSVVIARLGDAWWLHLFIALIGVTFLIAAQAFTTAHRPSRRELPGASSSVEEGGIDQKHFIFRGLSFSLVSAVALTGFLTSHTGAEFAGNMSTYLAILIGAAFGAAIFAVGWLAGWPVNWQAGDFWRWTASGLVYGGLLGLGARLFTLLSPYMTEISMAATAGLSQIWIIIIPIVLGIPWVLLSQLCAEIVFVGLVSYEIDSDADREWLGRAAGWVAAAAIIWAATIFITFAGGYFVIHVESWLKPYIASAGGIAGIIGAIVGKSAYTPAKPDEENQGFTAIASKVVLAIVGPVFAVVLVIAISVALDLLLVDDSLVQVLIDHSHSNLYILGWLAIGLIGAGAITWVASRSVNINRFSLHAVYRNRLVRAYLGATRQRRCPDKFTGFDDEDNLPAHVLWPPKACADGRNTFGLFHVVNITLNVVQSKRLAWQQRKAESFTVSALHSGAAYKGYRSSLEYAGPQKPFGISLGTAMAISGAAASPNMGYHSSPSVTLLLALFNVRLGWWLGNPGIEGEATYKDEGPATAIVPLVQETFGLTTDDKPYVYLSDGGHFENLGLYEMVRRRCRFILVIDAGCDPKFAFEDLGNAVRKIFIDLGIRITFTGLDTLKNRPTAKQLKQAGGNIPYHAVGTIHFGEADGEELDGKKCEDGTILYIKPAVHGTDHEGAGVRSYATANKTFPHETTADQWFTEAQFESYRSLGLDIANTILRTDPHLGTAKLTDILRDLSATARP